MRRRALLRRTTAALVLAGGVALAGCSGDGGNDGSGGAYGGGGGGGGDDGGEGPTLTVSGPVDGEVASNAIDELVVAELDSQVSDRFSVTVTLQNTGDERTSAMDYTYTLALFDDADTEMDSVASNKANLGAGMAPGQQGSVIATPQFYDGDAEDVARYELTVDCSEEEGDDRGVYCP